MSLRTLLMIIVLGLVLGAGGFTFLRCEGSAPVVKAPAEIGVGRQAAEVTLGLEDAGSGLRSLRVTLTHARGEAVLLERGFDGEWLRGAAVRPSLESVAVAIDPKALDLRDGDAILHVEVRDWSWRGPLSGNVTTQDVPVTIDLKPPRVSVENGLTYLRRAGSGAVVYSINEPAARDGVEVAGVFFPGHPFPGAPASGDGSVRRIALFGIPRDAGPDTGIQVVATDRVGNRSGAGWATVLQDRSFDEVEIPLPPSFLDGKIPALAEAVGVTAGEPLAAFQEINTRVRQQNEARIREITASSTQERLWDGAFEQLTNSKVTSRFAEHRTYIASGQKVSEAIHYGYDLAVTARAPITAANAGRVIWADDLGIYGNTVVLDHGLGLTSLYAHLSQIDVAVDERVEKGGRLGLSGATGLAGGDHLHFAILVGPAYVDPVEWWDPKWVQEHVEVWFRPPPTQ
jgi:hypothetical protein